MPLQFYTYQETVELSFQEAETFLWGLTATDVMG